MIYFDNAATTRAMPEAVEKMAHMLCEEYGNPASVSSMGLAVERKLKKQRKALQEVSIAIRTRCFLPAEARREITGQSMVLRRAISGRGVILLQRRLSIRRSRTL